MRGDEPMSDGWKIAITALLFGLCFVPVIVLLWWYSE